MLRKFCARKNVSLDLHWIIYSYLLTFENEKKKKKKIDSRSLAELVGKLSFSGMG